MKGPSRPTIKGLFVNSHIRALEAERGHAGLIELQRKVGHAVRYKTTDDVPVADEVRILEHIVEITTPMILSPEERELEAGRLHFRNFSTTVMWTLVNQIFGTNFKFLVMQSSRIASWVFRGIEFSSEDLGGNRIRISIYNNDYPLRHFHGFFEQWLAVAGVSGTVEATEHPEGRYDYIVAWR